MLADDATPEAMAVLLGRNKERAGLFSAEGGPFEMMAGRYSDKGSNFEIYLKAHAGDHHIVHRIKRESIQLTEPLLTMGLTVQPSVIAGLHAKDGFRGRGLLARFLYSLPKSPVGTRAIDSLEIPETEAAAYNRALLRLLLHPAGAYMLEMSPEADDARAALATELEPRLGPDGDLHAIGDWAGKYVGAVCRIAGVLHVADNALSEGGPGEICRRDLREGRADRTRTFSRMPSVAFDCMGADADTELAKRVWGWVHRQGKDTFTEREAYKAAHVSAEEIAPALAQLVERNLIRPGPSLPRPEESPRASPTRSHPSRGPHGDFCPFRPVFGLIGKRRERERIDDSNSLAGNAPDGTEGTKAGVRRYDTVRIRVRRARFELAIFMPTESPGIANRLIGAQVGPAPQGPFLALGGLARVAARLGRPLALRPSRAFLVAPTPGTLVPSALAAATRSGGRWERRAWSESDAPRYGESASYRTASEWVRLRGC